ncbi:MAG: retroviral-like aspartic protease family protein [Chitinophagales bacterium]|nr:retroviral-like aspartic protease family protein [Chitinophagales bacterium]
MENKNGIFMMPCSVNGLNLKFIFDTGASDVSISLTEANFMLKNGYLSKSDVLGTEYYRIANGEIEEGTKINLKEIQIGKIKIYNVKASVVHNLNAPLLLGQSALKKLGKIEFDYSNNTLSIKNGYNDYIDNNSSSYSNPYSNESSYTGQYKFYTTFDNPIIDIYLYEKPSVISKELYKCPKNSIIYVIDNTFDDLFFKVYVNGYTGYLTKGFLKRKW